MVHFPSFAFDHIAAYYFDRYWAYGRDNDLTRYTMMMSMSEEQT